MESSPERAERTLEDLRISTYAGGLIILGPSAAPLAGLDALLSSPEAVGVQASSTRLAHWKTAAAEATDVTRLTSSIVRDGKTAIVHLDSHSTIDFEVRADLRDFVCARLGQIMIGLADFPAYVAVHSQRMAQALIFDSLGDDDLPMLGSIAGHVPVWELTNRSMFPGVPVAVCPDSGAVSAMAQVLDWFEARRT